MSKEFYIKYCVRQKIDYNVMYTLSSLDLCQQRSGSYILQKRAQVKRDEGNLISSSEGAYERAIY